MLDVSAPGPLSSTARCLCFTQCTSCKPLFSFSLLGHYYRCNICSLRQLFNEKSLRETTSAPLLRVSNYYHPDCFFREHYLWYICVLPTSSTIVWMSQYPDCCLLQYVCTSYIIFRSDNNSMLSLPCLMIVFAVFLVSLQVISVSVQYNGRLLPDIILLTQCYHRRGARLNVMKRFCICSL